MPEITPHISLKKPSTSETVDISVINENMDTIDSALGDLSAVPTTAKTAAGAINELFTSVSDGKVVIAAAITDKGVSTAADDTFAEMADNIEAIPVGPDTRDATATAADILAPKTAYGAAGTKLTGTMVDRGNMSFTPGATAQTIPAGKHSGSGQVEAVVVPAANVLVGTTIAGTAGTMPNRAGDTVALVSSIAGTMLKLRASVGYRDGVDDNVTITDPNFTADNIADGTILFGKLGTLKQDGVYLSAPAERSTSSLSFVSVKKATVNYTGIVRVSFNLRPSSGGFFVQGVVYKNGIQFGTMRRTGGTSYLNYTEDLSASKGDYFELMLRAEDSGRTAFANNFLIETPFSPIGGIVDVN